MWAPIDRSTNRRDAHQITCGLPGDIEARGVARQPPSPDDDLPHRDSDAPDAWV
jgi:hypothetical protein